MLIIAEISDRAQFMKYAKAAADLVEECGGRYLVRGQDAHQLEGDWPDAEKLVISRWPSMDAALAFWNSPQYAKIKQLRAGHADVRVQLFEGCDE
jgi:uncharacterized protein (DUF1330 family)